MITQSFLKELFYYDSDSGWFTNRVTRGIAIEGMRAGWNTGHGYRKLTIEGQKIYEHHAAWCYVYGVINIRIDHWDGDGCRNAIKNLREATKSQNGFNAEWDTGTSGLKGAHLHSNGHSWTSKIKLGGRQIYLGIFDSAEEAHQAYLCAVEKYHGEFAFHNRPEPLVRRF